jgi:hypothetical protein
LQTSERATFDADIGVALRESSVQKTQSLARSFVFFFDPRQDAQRVVLLGALFRDTRVSGAPPLRLLFPLLSFMSRCTAPTDAVFVSSIKLVSSITDVTPASSAALELLQHIQSRDAKSLFFHRFIGDALLLVSRSAVSAALKMPLLALALRPFHMQLAVNLDDLRNKFTVFVLAIPDLLLNQPPSILSSVVAGVGLPTMTQASQMSESSSIALICNISTLIG